MKNGVFINEDLVVSRIRFIRGQRVMLDEDLAELYGVKTKRLNEQVKRNMERFPEDFMFQLGENEVEILRSQFATSSWGGRRVLPYAFTEHGVLMLSSVLNSETAIQVNIHIMRIYTKLREMLLTHKDILLKLEELEQNVFKNNMDIQSIFEVLKELVQRENEPRKWIGFNNME